MLEFKNISEVDEKINKYKNITNIISVIRFIISITTIIFFIVTLTVSNYLIYLIISISLFIIDLIFIISTNKYYKYLHHYKNKKIIYEIHQKRRDLKLETFFDNGLEFKSKNKYFESDLDIFGKHSLYQYLSSAKTKYGKEFLAKMLTEPEDLGPRFTNLIDHFANDEKTIDIEAALLDFKDTKGIDYDSLISVSNNKISLNPLMLLPLLSFIGTIIYFILIFTLKLNPVFIIFFLISNFFFSMLFLKNNIFDLDSSLYHRTCESYDNLCKEITNTNLEDEYFNNLKEDIKKEIPTIKKLKHLYSVLSFRKNTVVYFIANTLFSMDFFIIMFYNIKTKKVSKILDLFKDVAIIEGAISFSNIGIDNEVYCKGEDDDKIIANDLYHPLVKNCVPNDIEFKNGIILTGSNMSGKTTFMRTLGIAQILKNAGGLIPARKYCAPKLRLLTSLRANDMLSEGISTFYAEILRMKEMMSYYKEEKCLILVDEIFKGTNTLSRIKASEEVILKFENSNCFYIISTHDFELCDIKGIRNCHFNEYYENDKILFDYKIKEGKCETSNAIYLLKMSGIIDE